MDLTEGAAGQSLEIPLYPENRVFVATVAIPPRESRFGRVDRPLRSPGYRVCRVYRQRGESRRFFPLKGFDRPPPRADSSSGGPSV